MQGLFEGVVLAHKEWEGKGKDGGLPVFHREMLVAIGDEVYSVEQAVLLPKMTPVFVAGDARVYVDRERAQTRRWIDKPVVVERDSKHTLELLCVDLRSAGVARQSSQPATASAANGSR